MKLFKLWLAAMLLALPVHAAEINDFDVVDANNTGRWPEGMAFASVNDAGRAVEGILGRAYKDTDGSLVTTGAANAYAIAANRTLSAYYTGLTVRAKANHTNTGPATLNVDGIGATSIANAGASAIVSGRIYDFVHDGTNFQVLGQASEFPTGTKVVFFQAACPAGWTQDVANNNKALRLVSGTGGGTAGSQPFTTAFASQTPTGTTDGTAITEANLPAHRHFTIADTGVGDPGSGGPTNGTQVHKDFTGGSSTNHYTLQSSGTDATVGRTSSVGSGSAHSHSFTGNAINLAVQYLDVIICSRS